MVADITREADMANLVDQVMGKFGRIDVLVILIHLRTLLLKAKEL